LDDEVIARIGYSQDADLAVPVVVVLVGEVDLVRRLVDRDFQVARDARQPRACYEQLWLEKCAPPSAELVR
jgi:hypothetical protein